MISVTFQTKWAVLINAQEVFQYNIYEDGLTTIPRGLVLVNPDDLVTGFNTEQEAREWLERQAVKEKREQEDARKDNNN